MLVLCLRSLAVQEILPDEVFVVWQADDLPTRDAAEAIRKDLPYPLRVIHCPERGIVPAENTAMRAAAGTVILLIDDDAIAPKNWISRHLSFYDDDSVGAVGGPAINIWTDGKPFPTRTAEPIGKIYWFGRSVGNMYDHISEWQLRLTRDVDHLVGYNMSLRRSAIDQFETNLKCYWQMFEMDACLQVKGKGLRVLFDFTNVIEHHPTNSIYAGGREGDLQTKIYHAAYNHAFVLAKHSPWFLRACRLLYLLGIGSVNQPGILALPFCWRRYGNLLRELGILAETWRYHFAGWHAGPKCVHEWNHENLQLITCEVRAESTAATLNRAYAPISPAITGCFRGYKLFTILNERDSGADFPQMLTFSVDYAQKSMRKPCHSPLVSAPLRHVEAILEHERVSPQQFGPNCRSISNDYRSKFQ